jgi:TonB family protein
MGRLSLAIALAAASLMAADVSGKWIGPMETNGERSAVYLTLRQQGQEVTGAIAFHTEANPTPIEKAELLGDQLNFRVRGISMFLTVAGSVMSGDVKEGDVVSKLDLRIVQNADPKYTFEGGADTGPVLIHKVEPAVLANGSVTLYVQIGADGKVGGAIRVAHSLGAELDAKAIAAARQYRFRPATRHGMPVAVPATIEVNFRM